ALFECGLSIPGDVAIVGFDDIEAAAYATPSLTTIRQPFAEMASRAVSLLFQIIRGQPSEPVQIMLDPELILRESTAANSRTSDWDWKCCWIKSLTCWKAGALALLPAPAASIMTCEVPSRDCTVSLKSTWLRCLVQSMACGVMPRQENMWTLTQTR